MPGKQIQPLKRERSQSKSKTVVLQRRYGIIVYVLITHQSAVLNFASVQSVCLTTQAMERGSSEEYIVPINQEIAITYSFNPVLL